MSPRITKVKIESVSEETACEVCGWPIYCNDANYEIENLEHLGFCSRRCAVDYLHNAEYDMADSSTEGGYAIL